MFFPSPVFAPTCRPSPPLFTALTTWLYPFSTSFEGVQRVYGFLFSLNYVDNHVFVCVYVD